MSWHYLPELAAEYSAGTCLDGDVFVQSNTTSMQETCCSQDSGTDVCQGSQSGMMCEPSTENRGEAWLMLYLAGFRVKTFHQPEKEPELREQEADYGRKWHELSVKYDRNTHLWRTHRCLFDEDLPQSSVTLPKWGMMQSGVLFRLRTAERHTSENESGYLPTPRANDALKRGQIGDNLRNGLPAAVLHWPTPRTQMSRPVKARADQSKGHKSNLEEVVAITDGLSGGTLNPTWVEWLMGWPLGWTDCDVLATDKFQSWQQQHGVS